MNSPLLKTASIQNIKFADTFDLLSEEEKNYVYYLSKACWAGQPIVLFQTSYESPALFIIFQIFFSSFKEFSEIKKFILKNNITDVSYMKFLNYVANFYSNFGNYNYKKKIIPEIAIEVFEEILKVSDGFKDINPIWKIIKYIIYDDSENSIYINLEERNGKNGYYMGCIKEDIIKKTDKILRKNNYSLLNTRLIMLNSSKVVTLIGSEEEKQISLDEENILLFGEYSSFLKRINENLEDAKKYIAEKEILNDYIEFFKTGDIAKHKEIQKKWVNENSSIDFNLGWNENVIDPMGVRGLFEAFVGIENKFFSEKYEQLVNLIPQLISELPWDENFEKERYSVSFKSLEIICFARNGSPFGKCLPKYYEIKENYKTKNILFFNACPNYNSLISDYFFCDEGDIDKIKNFGQHSFKILTSLKQLMGYSSGKLFRVIKNEKNEDIYNFDKELKNPLTDNVIDKYYINNETFEEKFLWYAPILDECRSLLIGLYFSENKSIQEIFYVNKTDFKDVTYTIWLLQFSRAILGLKLYNESNKSWGHPYTQAVWIFMNYILESQQNGEEIIKINIDEEKEMFKIQLNKESLLLFGRDLISKLMIKVHIWKCTGDVESAVEFINHYSEVNETFLKLKKCVDNNKQTKRLFLFHNIMQNEKGEVYLKEYEESLEGIVESNIDRFGIEYNKDIYNQWIKYATNFVKI